MAEGKTTKRKTTCAERREQCTRGTRKAHSWGRAKERGLSMKDPWKRRETTLGKHAREENEREKEKEKKREEVTRAKDCNGETYVECYEPVLERKWEREE